jgi:iron only hydrogenase large subunit-like protein
MTPSVVLDPKKCCGCTACVKACPTEAIRVTRGKAVILEERCIDCGRCVQVCPHHAKSVISDSWDRMQDYAYNIALPDAVLYGQFQNMDSMAIVHRGLENLGFDKVVDVVTGAELLSAYWSALGDDTSIWQEDLPRITSGCPAALRLVAMDYPELLPNVIGQIAPFEAAAIYARHRAVAETGLPPEKIGVCLISPCPAQNTRARSPIGLKKPVVDYVLPINDVYVKLLNKMHKEEAADFTPDVGQLGLKWSRPGGLSTFLHPKVGLAVDGIDNIFGILDQLEDEKITEAQFIEASLCTQACFGGVLCVENPYTAKLRMRKIADQLPEVVQTECPDYLAEQIPWTEPLEAAPQFLADDLGAALKIQAEADRILKSLPKFNCGSCGAPSCAAFSRDVAQGYAESGDCIFNIIKKIRGGKSYDEERDEFVPPPFRKPI